MSFANHFSIANIPYGIASSDKHRKAAAVTRLGDKVIFLEELNLQVPAEVKTALSQPTLNALAAIDKAELQKLRQSIQTALKDESVVSSHGVPVSSVQMHMPIEVNGFTDFSCSREHCLNAGEAVLGNRSLPPGFLYFPVAYTGRSSSIVVSGTPIRRPLGQYKDATGKVVFGECKALDYEMEMGCIIGKPSKFGDRVSLKDADDHIFGFVLLNDWSARDIQGFEMMPLGPMNGKSFGTSISAWVVTPEALEPFAVAAPAKDEPAAAYLQEVKEKASYNVDMKAELIDGDKSTVLCTAKLGWMYWTFRDMVAQQTINGCNINTGDILATGTVSGIGDDEHGCLLELTRGGKVSFQLADGKKRTYLQDGDVVRLTALAGDGVGFGDCTGAILPATPL